MKKRYLSVLIDKDVKRERVTHRYRRKKTAVYCDGFEPNPWQVKERAEIAAQLKKYLKQGGKITILPSKGSELNSLFPDQRILTSGKELNKLKLKRNTNDN